MEKKSRIQNVGKLKRDLLVQVSISLKQRRFSIIQLLKLKKKQRENYDDQGEIHRCLKQVLKLLFLSISCSGIIMHTIVETQKETKGKL